MPDATLVASEWRDCDRCGTQLAPSLLSCPSCNRLVHSAELERLAAAAESAQQRGDLTGSLREWETALALLPESTRQHELISQRVMKLRAAIEHPASPRAPGSGWKAGAAGAGTVALVLWKFKFALVFLVTKAKFLLFGLTKMSTLLSMFAFFGVAWAQYGWFFAAGFVISIYIHEMGHVWALRRHGLPAGAPMFIPGIGALVRLKQHPPTESMDADIGLAGPLWGLGAAIAALGLHFVTGSELWTTIAWGGALINVFNLLPVWQLDGGRGFNAMSRHHRWIALGVLLIGWFISHNPIFVLLVLVAAGRALTAPAKVPDRKALVTYAGLVIAFSFLLRLHQPG